MEFIFRNPFVTKESKEIGMQVLEASETLKKTADTLKERNDQESAYKLYERSYKLKSDAALDLGFLSAQDMERWIESGKKL